MKRCESKLEITLERDNDTSNEERLLAAFEMIFTGVEISLLDIEALTASSEEPI
jgi:hypothetical protein